MVAEPWQLEAFAAWDSEDPKALRIALQACTGPGKTRILAVCGLQALVTRGSSEQHVNGFAVSITKDNLKDNLWKELAVLYQMSPIIQKYFDFRSEQIVNRKYPKTWWLKARAFAQKADPEAQGRTLSGLHAPFIFYLLDEAGDMPPSLSRTAEQGLGKGELWGKILMAGNPTSLNGALYTAAVMQAGIYTVIRITGDPADPRRSQRIDPANAQLMIDTYGRDNPWVMATILGKFPPQSLNALFSPDELREAMQRPILEHQYDFAQKRLGIDVARFGDDSTVIFPRQGLRAFNPVQMRGAKTTEIAARIAVAKSRWRSELEFIDDTGGWAGGVIDQCELINIMLVAVNSSSTNVGDHRYANRRAEMYFLLSQWIKDGGTLPNLPKLIPQLTAIKYFFNKGKFQILEKDQIKRDLAGASPDEADALALTFALPELPAEMEDIPGMPNNVMAQIRNQSDNGRAAAQDWDPYNSRGRDYANDACGTDGGGDGRMCIPRRVGWSSDREPSEVRFGGSGLRCAA